MADAVLRVYAQDGSNALQIDSTYRNFFLRSKQVVQLTDHNLITTGSNVGEKWINVDCQTTPVVAIAQAAGFGGPVAVDLAILPPAGGHGTPGVYSIDIAGPLNATVEVFVFDALKPSDMAGSGAGLKVWNAAGQPVYNSLAKPLRVVDVLTASRLSMPTGVAIPSGRRYGVICNGGGYTQTTGSSPIVYLYFLFGGAITTTGYATIGIFNSGSNSGSGVTTDYSTTAFVVDLTNY